MGGAPEEHDERRWEAKPWLGFAVQTVLGLLPFAVGVAAGRLAVTPLLPSDDRGTVLAAYGIAALVATLAAVLVQPLTRRLMPLAWLLRLSMLFPGRAPSRFKVARSRGRVTDLQRALESGKLDTPADAAQRILGLVAVLTNHDRRTRGHAERVRVFTDLLSAEMGLSRDDRDKLRWAALLHDIGKLHVPRKVLNKPGKPSEVEWAILREHPVHGEQLLGSLRDWLGEWGDTVRQHHERWDGAGYPAGLTGREINLGARIVAVADSYEVMTAARSYKRPMAASAAREELVRCSGGQFDPHVVRAFMSIPLVKLRWALGPFAWVAELPLLRQVAHAGHTVAAGEGAVAAVGAAGTAAMTAASLVAGPTPAAASPEPRPAATAPVEQAGQDPAEALADVDRVRSGEGAHDGEQATEADGGGSTPRHDGPGAGSSQGSGGTPTSREPAGDPTGGPTPDDPGTDDPGTDDPGTGDPGTEAPTEPSGTPTSPAGPVEVVTTIVDDVVVVAEETVTETVETATEVVDDVTGVAEGAGETVGGTVGGLVPKLPGSP